MDLSRLYRYDRMGFIPKNQMEERFIYRKPNIDLCIDNFIDN